MFLAKERGNKEKESVRRRKIGREIMKKGGSTPLS
jgi:hypothetical protein